MVNSRAELIRQIQTRGLVPSSYSAKELVGVGSCSLVLDLGAQLVLKVTSCAATVRLLDVLKANPRPDFVQVFESVNLGEVGPDKTPAHGFVLERLAAPTVGQMEEFAEIMGEVANRMYSAAGKPPRRGTPGYTNWCSHYCAQAARHDQSRMGAWEFLAAHVLSCADDFQSVDVLTEGNMLTRGDTLIFSDPVRRVVVS